MQYMLRVHFIQKTDRCQFFLGESMKRTFLLVLPSDRNYALNRLLGHVSLFWGQNLDVNLLKTQNVCSSGGLGSSS